MLTTTRFIISLMLLLIVLLHVQPASAATDTTQAAPSAASNTFKPVIMLKSHATYSMDEEKNGTAYANRFDSYLRHLRFGAKGEASPGFMYSFMFHYDQLGEDTYAATRGSDKGVGLWNAYISVRVLPESDLLYVHAGYYWAAISREYNTSPWAVSSFDKSYAVWYLRNFLTAKGNGIESGMGIGGLVHAHPLFNVSYRASVHKPDKHDSPHHAGPLINGRVMFSFGDPEQKKYTFMLSGNQWCGRKGITIGLGGAYQGKTDNELSGSDHIFFDSSYAYGTDILLNYAGLRIDGEYFLMKRTAESYDDFDGTEWHLRVAYNFKVKDYYIEPSCMITSYKGSGEQALYNYTGDDKMYDFGINWYIAKEKTKLALHYVIQDGSVSSNKGDYLGMSLQLKV